MNSTSYKRPFFARSDSASVEERVEAAPARTPLLLQYYRMALRRKWIVLGATIATVAAGLIVTLLMTPLYTAETTLEIQRESFNIVQVDGVEPQTSSIDSEFYQTQYGLLRSRSLAQRVARDLRLFDDATFFEKFGDPDIEEMFGNGRPISLDAASRDRRVRKAGEILIKNMAVAPVRLSRLVDISFTSADAALSARIVDSWASNFIEATLERRFEATSYARKFLEQRIGQLKGRLEDSERLLVSYASRERIINLPAATPAGGTNGVGGERPLIADDLAAINNALAQATADRVEAQSRVRSSGGSVTEALENAAITGLRQRRAEVAAEYARVLVQFEPGYPTAVALAAQMNQLDQSIAREESRVGTSIQTAYVSAVARERDLKARVGILQNDLLDLQRRTIQYNIYQRDVDTNRELYDGLLQRYKEIGVAGGVGVNNIAIVDQAEVPRRPSSPRMLVNLAISLLLGLALGGGIALALEQIDETISDPSDVAELLQLPLLGTVPKVKEENPTDALRDRKSAIVEAYLSVQTNLEFASENGVPRTIAVTSTRASEGKSTTSYALATSLARSGRRVLLVDGDMRSPSVHNMFGIANEAGLSNYLIGKNGFDSLTIAGPIPNLWIMTAGPQPLNAAELLTGARIQALLDSLLEAFDTVVIDSPPVMGLADAPLIASHVEGVIFAIEAKGTKVGMARVAIDRLVSARARVLGIVLTKFDAIGSHYGYGYGYGYGREHDRPSVTA